MKPHVVVSIFLVAAISFAERIAPPTLPSPVFADTEVSTNIVIAADEGSRHFSVSLLLNATASNNVEVVVGDDSAPADGVLSPTEESLCFGWDCGSWFLSANNLTNRVGIAPVGADARKSLTLRLGINSDGAVRDISLLDGETPLPVTQFAAPTVSHLNLLRVTARGIDDALENLVVRHSPDGTMLIFK